MAYLTAISLSRGRSRPISDLVREGADPAAISSLAAEGFRDFVEDGRPVAGLAAEAAAASLGAWGRGADAVDAVVVATESAWDVPADVTADVADGVPGTTRFRNGLLEALAGIGLARAYPYGIAHGSCANLAPALAFAAQAVGAGMHRSLLVVAADRQPRTLPRLMRNHAAVYSDIAAAAVVTAERPDTGVAIGEVVPVARLDGAAEGEAAEPAGRIMETLHAVRLLKRRYEARTGSLPAAADHIVANNFHRQSLSVITDTLGLREREIRMDSKPLIAHGHAADPLATLGLMIGGGAIGHGQSVLLVSSAVHMWSLVRLTGL